MARDTLMSKYVLGFTLCAALLMCVTGTASLSAQAPRVDGAWAGEATAPAAPPFPVTMVLKANGRTLTGTISVDDGPPVPIEEGTIDGDTVSFWFSWFGGAVPCEGRATATEIRLKAPTEIGITFDIVLTRKK